MNLLVISNNYPSQATPNYGAFVYNLMQELAKFHEVTIISPYKINLLFTPKNETYGKDDCRVLRPIYCSVGNRKLGMVDLGRVSAMNISKAYQRALQKLPRKPDIVYAHFLSNAIHIADYVQTNNLPLVVASGESTYNSWINTPVHLKDKLFRNVRHIIAVSQENKIQLCELGFDDEIITVIPNAVDYNLFRPMDKIMCKNKLGFSSNDFVIGFVGHFNHRKGPNRIIKAIKSMEDKDIKLICVGNKGKLIQNEFTKILSPVPNYQLPEIYNAFDVFVLPTLNEGHCNVIEEAKACGIPVISSKGTSVEEQIDDSTGVLIDPLKISEISNAISELKQNKKILQIFENNLISKRGHNSLHNRAKKIDEVCKKVV